MRIKTMLFNSQHKTVDFCRPLAAFVYRCKLRQNVATAQPAAASNFVDNKSCVCAFGAAATSRREATCFAGRVRTHTHINNTAKWFSSTAFGPPARAAHSARLWKLN